MQPWISLLTAAGVLVHFVWGCCGHQACAVTKPAKQVAVETKSAGHKCCHHRHACDSPPTSQPKEPAEDDRCDHGECSFFGAEVLIPQVAPAAVLVFDLPAEVDVSTFFVADLEATANHFALPCRVHLWCGVLLI